MEEGIPWGAVFTGLLPSLGIGLLFFFAIRAIIHADRNERRARADQEQK